MNRVRLLFPALLLVLPVFAVADGIEKTFDVVEDGLLTVDAEGARISVVSGDNHRLVVKISRDGDSAEEIAEDYEVELTQSGNEVFVGVEKRTRGSGWFDHSPVIEVVLPKVFNVDLHTSGGQISVANLAGEIEASTSGGSLRFEDIQGPIYGRTSGGSIGLTRASGDVDLHTSGGSIRIGEVIGFLKAGTSGGSITVDRVAGSMSARTSGGSIKVADVSGAIKASTSGGSIRVSMTGQPESDSKLTTSGGSVMLRIADSLAVNFDAKGRRVYNELSQPIDGRVSDDRLKGAINGGGPRISLRGGKVTLAEI